MIIQAICDSLFINKKIDSITLKDLIDAKVIEYVDVFNEIVDEAEAEFQEETMMQNIEEELRNLDLRFEPCDDHPTLLII